MKVTFAALLLSFMHSAAASAQSWTDCSPWRLVEPIEWREVAKPGQNKHVELRESMLRDFASAVDFYVTLGGSEQASISVHVTDLRDGRLAIEGVLQCGRISGSSATRKVTATERLMIQSPFYRAGVMKALAHLLCLEVDQRAAGNVKNSCPRLPQQPEIDSRDLIRIGATRAQANLRVDAHGAPYEIRARWRLKDSGDSTWEGASAGDQVVSVPMEDLTAQSDYSWDFSVVTPYGRSVDAGVQTFKTMRPWEGGFGLVASEAVDTKGIFGVALSFWRDLRDLGGFQTSLGGHLVRGAALLSPAGTSSKASTTIAVLDISPELRYQFAPRFSVSFGPSFRYFGPIQSGIVVVDGSRWFLPQQARIGGRLAGTFPFFRNRAFRATYYGHRLRFDRLDGVGNSIERQTSYHHGIVAQVVTR